MDNNIYKCKNNPNASKSLDDMIGKHNLIDIWRVKNPHTKCYTWLQGLSNKQARLDYYLCNEELLNISSNEDIGYKYRSDHSPITITFTINDQKRGPGGWKFNNNLLRDPTFIKTIKKEIQKFKEVHAATPYHPNYVMGMSKNIDYMANPHIIWETLQATLRGTIIKYSKKVKRDKTNRTHELEQKISELDQKITSGYANIEKLEKLRELNTDLIEIRKEELKGALIRSRAEWLDLGEKPSKFFLNLENRNKVNKMINEIKLDDNTILRKQSDILCELKNFYEKLYSRKIIFEEDGNNIDLSPKQITEDEKLSLENPITKQELDIALKTLKNNKSPGPDGYSPEFYIYFWPELGYLFLEYVNSSHKKGCLTTAILEGTITCLPNTGKSRNLLKNWRPISLLNTSYKLISTCITKRLCSLLKK